MLVICFTSRSFERKKQISLWFLISMLLAKSRVFSREFTHNWENMQPNELNNLYNANMHQHNMRAKWPNMANLLYYNFRCWKIWLQRPQSATLRRYVESNKCNAQLGLLVCIVKLKFEVWISNQIMWKFYDKFNKWFGRMEIRYKICNALAFHIYNNKLRIQLRWSYAL
jgi:hypothetical protein